MTPEKEVVSESVEKVVAEARNGSFCLEPRHIDFLAELVPGIFSYWIEQREHLLAIDGGILVKKNDEVTVSVRHAIKGDHLAELESVVREKFRILDEKERETQIALEQLQADFIKRFIEFQKEG
jgi:F-type H+-transporting ATPase subunit epsilon